jgi:hypothetical protein
MAACSITGQGSDRRFRLGTVVDDVLDAQAHGLGKIVEIDLGADENRVGQLAEHGLFLAQADDRHRSFAR